MTIPNGGFRPLSDGPDPAGRVWRLVWNCRRHPRDDFTIVGGACPVLGVVANLIALDAQTRHRAKLERHNLEVENQRLRTALQERHRPDTMIGNLPLTPQMPEGDKPAAASLTDRVELLEKDLIVERFGRPAATWRPPPVDWGSLPGSFATK